MKKSCGKWKNVVTDRNFFISFLLLLFLHEACFLCFIVQANIDNTAWKKEKHRKRDNADLSFHYYLHEI